MAGIGGGNASIDAFSLDSTDAGDLHREGPSIRRNGAQGFRMEFGLLRTRSSFGESALIEHVSPSDSDNCDESWSNRDFCGNTRPEKLSKSSGHMIFRAINPINCWTSARKSECGKSECHGPWSEEFTAISASNFVRYALAF